LAQFTLFFIKTSQVAEVYLADQLFRFPSNA
jgi:hypothetical protein